MAFLCGAWRSLCPLQLCSQDRTERWRAPGPPGPGRQKAWWHPKELGVRQQRLLFPVLDQPRCDAQSPQVPARPQLPATAGCPATSGPGPWPPCQRRAHPVPASVQRLPAPHAGADQDSSGNVSIEFSSHPMKPFALFSLPSLWQTSTPCLPTSDFLGAPPRGFHCLPALSGYEHLCFSLLSSQKHSHLGSPTCGSPDT